MRKLLVLILAIGVTACTMVPPSGTTSGDGIGVTSAPASASASNDMSDTALTTNTPSRQFSHSVDLTMYVSNDKDESVRSKISNLVETFGGYVEQSSFLHVVAYVPTQNSDEFLGRLGRDVAKLHDVRHETYEITSIATATATRLDELKARRARYLDMLNQGDISVSEKLSVEQALSQVESQIAVLTKNIKAMQNMADYTRVDIDLDNTPMWARILCTPLTPIFGPIIIVGLIILL